MNISSTYFTHAIVAIILGIASGAYGSVYIDTETGFTFSQSTPQYAIGKSLTFRIAVPSPVPANTAYDAVLQIAAPIDVGWAGLAWGSGMLNNPLTVTWTNGNTPMLSSRYATAHQAPSLSTLSTYTILRTGTHTNSTHFQLTAKCSGCTSYNGKILNPTGVNNFAFSYSSQKPATPASNASSLVVHDVTGYFGVNFAEGGNGGFEGLVGRNL